MHLHQLTVFVEVAKTKNFSKAAENLFLSQSTVSTHINNLEKDLGQPLFDRIGRQAILTPSGKKLFYWAEQILAMKKKALDCLCDNDKLPGEINISSSSVPAQFIVPKMVSAFNKNYPNSKFYVKQNSSKVVATHLLKGLADIAFVGDKHFTESIEYYPLIKEQLVLITPKNIKLEAPIGLETLSRLNLVFRFSGSGTRENIIKVLKNNGFDVNKLNIIGYYDNVQSITQSVKEGMASSIVSKLALTDINKDKLNIYHLEEFKNYHRWFYLAVHKKRTLSSLGKRFKDFIVENATSH
ncbi:selenium metabolism-associated LysR family transcriptional regulator [Proteinivorax hydrogeniformans]|uniref:Selenium metabolism-associated LysR family transcriptional regulator n=1 Tax=Proteinivorax hydrogeniformans TaxID=1826727 RepID=A0AAU8HVR6_9FIRM